MLAATYDEFERVLREARALPEPAEAHGTLAGALCSSRDYGLLEWLHEILPDDSPEDEALQSSVLQNVYDVDGAHAGRQRRGFRAAAARRRCAAVGTRRCLEPVVPGLPVRTRFRPGRRSVARCPRRRAKSFATSPRSRTWASTPDEENEENEVAFAEVVEFVRVGVQLLFVEFAPARGQEPAPGAASIH